MVPVVSIAFNVVLLCVGGTIELTLCNRFVSAVIKARSDLNASLPCIIPVILRIVTPVCVMIGVVTGNILRT